MAKFIQRSFGKKGKIIDARNQSVTVWLVRGLSLRFGAYYGSDKAGKVNGSGFNYRADADYSSKF